MQPRSLSASTLTGDKVTNLDGDKLGHLEEIVIDLHSGRVDYAVLSSGGFLGLGDKLFAIPWDLITVDSEREEIVLDISKETLENAPGFDKDNWPDVHDRDWVDDVYRYYGSEPYRGDDGDPTVEEDIAE
jgi:sporulation protein YlmC with PRC-barrel domain